MKVKVPFPISSFLISIAPFFSSWILLSIPILSEEVSRFFVNYISFLLLFGAWHLLTTLSVKYRSLTSEPVKEQNKKVVNKTFFLLTVAAVVTLFFLHNVRLKFPQPFFLTTLLVMVLRGVSIVPWVQKSPWKNLTIFFLATFGTVFLSLEVAVWHLEWQTFLFAFGLASSLSGCHLASILATKGPSIDRPENWLKVMTILLFLGPTVVGLFPLLGQLSRTYLLVYVALPVFGQVLAQYRTSPEIMGDMASLERPIERGTLLFLLLIVLASVLT